MNWTIYKETTRFISPNDTHLADDPLDEEQQQNPHPSSGVSFTFCLRLALYFIIVVTDMIIIYIICKFKLKSYEIRIIFHWSLFNMLFFVLGRVAYLLFYHALHFETMPCYVFEIVMGSLAASFIFAFGLYVYWILLYIKSKYLYKYKQFYIPFLYFLAILYYSTAVSLCYSHDGYILNNIYGTILCATMTLNLFKYFYRSSNEEIQKYAYVAIAANTIIYSFAPLFIFHCLFLHFHSLSEILYTTMIIPNVVALSSPMAVFYILWKFNKDFGTGIAITYERIFKREKDVGWTEILVDDAESIGM